jgi:hypothetical protein
MRIAGWSGQAHRQAGRCFSRAVWRHVRAASERAVRASQEAAGAVARPPLEAAPAGRITSRRTLSDSEISSHTMYNVNVTPGVQVLSGLLRLWMWGCGAHMHRGASRSGHRQAWGDGDLTVSASSLTVPPCVFRIERTRVVCICAGGMCVCVWGGGGNAEGRGFLAFGMMVGQASGNAQHSPQCPSVRLCGLGCLALPGVGRGAGTTRTCMQPAPVPAAAHAGRWNDRRRRASRR